MTDYTVPRDSRRVPLATRVQLKFEWFSGFISEYSANISPGGMFIRTQTPEPPGRMLGFEFRLGDGFELIQGTGEVMWVRPLDESPEKPAGMGIRFLELSPHSRELIARMVENYIREGGTPFDVANAPPPASTLTPAPAPIPPAPALAPPSAPPATAPAPLPDAASAASAPGPRLTPPPAAPPPVAPPPARGAGQPSSWTSILAGAVAPPAEADASALAIPERAEVDRAADERPVRVSRIVLWTLFAAFLGGAAWVALSQDLVLGWLTRRGGAAAAPPAAASPRRAARLHRRESGGPPPAPVRLASEAPPAPPARLPEATRPPPAPAPEVAAAPAPSAAAAPSPAAATAVASPAAVPPAASPAVAATAPLTAIEKITWQQGPEGTEVVLWGNGTFRRQDCAHYRVEGDPPRVLVKLRGIRRPFAEGRLLVGTRQVRQVRTGYHDEGAGGELHVVLDLAGFGVEVTGMQEDAAKLHIYLKGT
jgi:molecular chaperone DnaK